MTPRRLGRAGEVARDRGIRRAVSRPVGICCADSHFPALYEAFRAPGAGESEALDFAAEGATGPRKRSGTRDRVGIGISGKPAHVPHRRRKGFRPRISQVPRQRGVNQVGIALTGRPVFGVDCD